MATTADEQIFIDTNILVYAKLAHAPLHLLALQRLNLLQDRAVPLWISSQVIREYLAVMSKPGTVAPALPMAALITDLQDFRRRFRVADDSPAVTDKLVELVTHKNVSGKQVHDANIVATMLVYGVEQLLTHNVADFARYADTIRILPLQA